MSEVKFEAAKELIVRKKYAEARIILRMIDDPKAREWEAELEALEPEFLPAPLTSTWSQPRIVLKSVVVDKKAERKANINKQIIYVVILIVIILMANMLGIFMPKPKVDDQSRATASAFNHSLDSTRTAIYATKSAVPTYRPILPLEASQAAIRSQTREAVSSIQTGTYVMDKATWDAEFAASVAEDSTAQAMTLAANISRTVEPTIVFTPISPAYYVAIENNSLHSCPYVNCESMFEIKRSKVVTIVGIVQGDSSNRYADKWYKIQLTDRNGNTYYGYQHIELFVKAP